ncbi:hypothetical protein A3731_02220 [Roseovarius sp. HI0049]|nr:hypothetical protein A3731_02220 [Roseovarius sp. HI0049]
MATRRVLILEDQNVVALDVASMLEDKGYTPVIVCNSAEGANRAIDLALPDLGIVDLGRRERRKRIDTAARLAVHARPVLFLTDGANPLSDLPEAMRDYDIIVKPFSDTCVLRTVESLVLGKGAQGLDLPGEAAALSRATPDTPEGRLS